MSFSTVFQSNQEGWIWKAVCNGTLFAIKKIPAPSRSQTQDLYAKDTSANSEVSVKKLRYIYGKQIICL